MKVIKLAVGAVLALIIGCSTQYNGGDTLGGGSLNPGSLGALGDGGGAGTFACDSRSIDSHCANLPTGTDQPTAQSSCDGTLLTTACSQTNSVGTCTLGPESDVYYSDGPTPFNPTSAQADCAAIGGTFN